MIEQIIGKRISIPEQFTGSVTVESAKVLEDIWLLKIRNQQGELHDAYLSIVEAEEILANYKQVSATPVDANQFFLFIRPLAKISFKIDLHLS